MKLFISADMEGITGVTSMRQVSSRETAWNEARIWMTEDVNAAVEGACEAGATEVVVRDAHGPATNILPDRLHPACRLMAGWTPVLDMLQGLDDSYGLAFFIGYHPGPGSPAGVLSHTFSMKTIREVQVNGISSGESLINAIQAGIHRVPVGLVTGERALQQEIAVLGEVEFVGTKVGYGYQSALLEPMMACRRRIRETAAQAVRRQVEGPGYQAYLPDLPIHARIEFHKAEAALACQLVPGVERTDVRAIDFTADTARDFIRTFQLVDQILYGLDL